MLANEKQSALQKFNKKVPDGVWAPVVTGVLKLVVGLLGVNFSKPWLFPSLAPTAYLQGEQHKLASSKLYHVLVGHFVGLGVGFLAVVLFNAWSQPIELSTHVLTLSRVAAAALAIGLTTVVNMALHASHPPAGVTTLLVALGAFNILTDAVNVVAGVVILGAISEVFRRIRLGK